MKDDLYYDSGVKHYIEPSKLMQVTYIVKAQMKRALFSTIGILVSVLHQGVASAQYTGGPPVSFNASRDIAENKVKYFIVGQPRAQDEYFVTILKDKYAIKVIMLGCTPSSEEARSATSYNSEIVSFFEKKYGKDFIAQAEQQAKDQFQTKQQIAEP